MGEGEKNMTVNMMMKSELNIYGGWGGVVAVVVFLIFLLRQRKRFFFAPSPSTPLVSDSINSSLRSTLRPFLKSMTYLNLPPLFS